MAANERATASRKPPHYEIRVRGPLGPTIMQAFPALTMSRHGQDALLTGSLPDQSALYGVIHQLEALGLQLQEIRRLPTGDPPTTRPMTSPTPGRLISPGLRQHITP
jgi:hypothetical protein